MGASPKVTRAGFARAGTPGPTAALGGEGRGGGEGGREALEGAWDD